MACGARSLVPAPYLVIILGVAATLLQQSAFHAGALQTSVPTMLVLEPLVAVSLGVVVLGETLAVTSIATVALLAVAVVAMAAATIALGRDEGAFEEQLEAEIGAAQRVSTGERRVRPAACASGRPPVASNTTRLPISTAWSANRS